MNEPQQRNPRFQRVRPKRFVLTDRDIEIIRQVFTHRFLRSTHLTALVSGSAQKTLRRLALLYHAGYLDRPYSQLQYYARAAQPMVYALGDRGADLLSERFQIPRGKVVWTAKNRAISRVFLNHTLLIADVMVAIEAACRQRPNVRLIDAEEILKDVPEETRKRQNPFQWSVTTREDGQHLKLAVIPDKVFGLHFTDKPSGRNKAYFFLEADRASMPVVRASFRQTSFYRKIVAYFETWRQGLHTKQFGIRNFRVLTVTTSKERAKNLLEANTQLEGGGSRIFLFTDEESLAGENIFSLELLNGRCERMKLMD